MNNPKQPILLPFRCPKCGKMVVMAMSGAHVLCNTCKIWIKEPAKANTTTA